MRWIGLIIFMLTSRLWGAEFLLLNSEHHGQWPIGSYVDILEDPHGEFTAQQVSGEPFEPQWVRNHKEILNLGYINSTYWVRISLKSPSTDSQNFLLELAYPHHDFVDFYLTTPSGSLEHKSCGRSRKFAERDIAYRNCVFAITLQQDRYTTFYLRSKSEGSMQLPIIVWQPVAFATSKILETAGLFLYYGTMIVMVIYNCFLFFSTRKINYLYYVLYISCFVLFAMSLNGVAFEFLWPGWPWWGRVSIVFFGAFAMLWMMIFNRSFLNTRINTPTMDKILFGFEGAAFIILVCAFFASYRSCIIAVCITAIAGLLVAYATGLLCLKRGYRPARYFVLAFSLFIFGNVIFGLRSLGLIPAIAATEFAHEIGSAIEVVLLSLALADWIKNEQKAAQLKIERLNVDLEDKVEKQTNDIMNQKEQLAKANEELKQLDKQKTHFFQNISHEIRTPLTLILGTQEKLTKKYPTDAIIEVASKNTKRLYRLVNQLLDFQRIESTHKELKLTPIDMVSFIKICSDYFDSAASIKGIRFKTTFNGGKTYIDQKNDKIVINGEIDALEKVTLNFLSNAMKYSPTGGMIELGITAEEDRVRIFVKDEGPGISLQNQDKLFKIFSQVDDSTTREYEGTGLGLALSKELTVKMGGKIGIDSRVGSGSCFWAEFPRCSGWKTIIDLLIVDDEPILADILKVRIESFNSAYRVQTAISAREARALIRQHQIKVLLTDHGMPEEDGASLLTFMAKEQPQCARLMFTGQADQTVLQRAINQGSVQRVYYKPVDFELILPEIVAFIDQSPIHQIDEVKDKFTVKDWLLEKVDSPTKLETDDITPDDAADNDQELILVIDDLRDMRNLIGSILKEHNFRVVTASDGAEGLAKASTHKPHLIIVDWMMPKMPGPEFIKNLRAIDKFASIPVILLTAKTDQQSKLAGLAVGADAFLGKPFDELEMVSTVTNLLRLKSGEQKVANSLEDKNILVAMITHDIANPLMAATSATEMLEMTVAASQFADNTQATRCFDILKKSTTSISSIISQVKLLESVDNKQIFNFKPVSVSEAFEESLFIVKDKMTEKNIVVESTIDNIAVLCDKSALVHSVIVNLLTNAIKFSQHGGKVTCMARQLGEDRVVIAIADEGHGIPDAMQGVLFSIGHQTSRPGTAGEKGTGFGLPIVKKLLTKMGGTITVESPYRLDTGKMCSGSKFSIELPKHRVKLAA